MSNSDAGSAKELISKPEQQRRMQQCKDRKQLTGPLLMACALLANAQEALTNDAGVKMVKAGVTEMLGYHGKHAF
jgi:hypothetical protein